jgi:2-polyprenyl-6-methoxyphenol hydroxylase-like FAD-dependent oxidoreductase
MEAAGFVRSTGNTVWWGSHTPRVEYFGEGEQGWQVTTDRLEAVLHQSLTSAGVVVEDARVDPAAVATRNASFMLDCTGRAGVLARARGLRRYESSQRTIALLGLWETSEPFRVADGTHTLVESYEGGWAWSVPERANRRFVAVMVDPQISDLVRDTSAREVYLHEINRTVHMADLVGGAQLVEGPAGWDASMYHASRYVDGNVLLVGDAASFIDPLSSAGVKKALASGWLAAVAVHTSLRRPAMRGVALEFYASREAEVYASFKAMAKRMLAEGATGHVHPFWTDRAEAEPSGAERDLVARAFERLRTQPELRLVRNPEGRIEGRPAVSGAEIVWEPRLVSAARPEGVRYAFDVDLIGLVELAPVHASLPALFDAYNQRHAPVALPDLLGALSTAIAHEWLVWV